MFLPLTPIEEAWSTPKVDSPPVINRFRDPDFQTRFIHENVGESFSSTEAGNININVRDRGLVRAICDMDPGRLTEITTTLLKKHFGTLKETFVQGKSGNDDDDCIDIVLVLLLVWLFVDRVWSLVVT